MTFKLRSGNSPMFNKIGEEKETPEQYNARVRTEYEAKLQAHSDSTASYNQAVIIDDLYKKGRDIRNKGTQELLDSIEYKRKDPAAFDKEHGCGKGFFADARGKCIEETMKGADLIIEGKVLEDDLRKTGIYPTERRGLSKTGESEYTYNPTAESIKPGPAPIEPMEMLDRAKIKNIDMEMEQKTPYTLEGSKRKYMTSSDGKWKINLETGEKTKVKIEKVKKTKKPRKRSVKNLVTGGYNKVQ